MNDNRKFLRIAFILTGFGILSLGAIIGNSHFANMRTVDMVRLIGTGMCFGAAIVAFSRGRRSA